MDRASIENYSDGEGESSCAEHKNDFQSKTEYIDTPNIAWHYTDHEKKCDMVCVPVSIIAGSPEI